MKSLLTILLFILYTGILQSHGQCSNYTGNINNLPVCGFYGDANGNSNWNWELTDKLNPNYCPNWYARIDASGNAVPMGSPFVDANTTALDVISQQRDFTRDKGWELLRRDFGCSNVTAYPYFVLYNKYSGLLRLFVYVPAGAVPYSGIAVEVTPNVNNAYPATTAFSDTLQTTPDKFLSSTPGGNFGKGMVAVGQLAGLAGWSLIEINPSFDPNIQAAVFTGSSLEFKIYGVLTNNMYASIRGGSVASNQPVYNFSYKPTQPKQPNGSDFDFKGVGEMFTKFTTTENSLRTDINNIATNAANFLKSAYPKDTLLSNVTKFFENIKNISSTIEKFDSTIKITEVIKAIGNFFGIVGTIISLFTGSSGTGGTAAYTNYDLVLQGTITSRVTTQSFVLRVPGTNQNNNDNAPYYKCPLGIFNLKNTPEADSVNYDRTDRYRRPNEQVLPDYPIWRKYVSYRIRNNITASYNDGAGLDLVSAQAAFVGEILPDENGNASYDLFEQQGASKVTLPGYWRAINFLRADIEIGRIVIKRIDPVKKLHTFQTPYTDLGCLNGLSFTVPATTKVYLQVKAVLKKKNDPSQKPIVYIQNYKLQTFAQTIDEDLQSNLRFNPKGTFPPYANYTQLPLFTSDIVIADPFLHTSPTWYSQADNSVATSGVLLVPPSSTPTYYVAGNGGEVDLHEGFEVQAGAEFGAWTSNYGYSLNCTTPQIDAYAFPGNCYNTAITALRESTNPDKTDNNTPTNVAGIRVYPVPASNTLLISGISNLDRSTISIVDQSGRTVQKTQQYAPDPSGSVSLDVSGLSNGVYFITIQTTQATTTRKIVISR